LVPLGLLWFLPQVASFFFSLDMSEFLTFSTFLPFFINFPVPSAQCLSLVFESIPFRALTGVSHPFRLLPLMRFHQFCFPHEAALFVAPFSFLRSNLMTVIESMRPQLSLFLIFLPTTSPCPVTNPPKHKQKNKTNQHPTQTPPPTPPHPQTPQHTNPPPPLVLYKPC